MIHPGLLAAAGVSIWVYVVTPVGTMMFTAALAYAGFYPHIKERRVRHEEEQERQKRMDETMDAVLGCDPDPRIGKRRVIGLREVVPDLQKAIGVSANGKSVVEQVRDLDRKVSNVGHGQEILSQAFEEHERNDDRRFTEIGNELQGVKRTVSELAEGHGR